MLRLTLIVCLPHQSQELLWKLRCSLNASFSWYRVKAVHWSVSWKELTAEYNHILTFFYRHLWRLTVCEPLHRWMYSMCSDCLSRYDINNIPRSILQLYLSSVTQWERRRLLLCNHDVSFIPFVTNGKALTEFLKGSRLLSLSLLRFMSSLEKMQPRWPIKVVVVTVAVRALT